jgi:hypothetical protein
MVKLKLPCGSASTASTLRPSFVKPVTSAWAVVVFPTPPFWFITVVIRGKLVPPLACTRSGAKLAYANCADDTAKPAGGGVFSNLFDLVTGLLCLQL